MSLSREEQLEDALLDILDVVSDWHRPMTDEEKLAVIACIAEGARSK